MPKTGRKLVRKACIALYAGVLLLYPAASHSVPKKPQGLVSDYAGVFPPSSPVRRQLEAVLVDLRKKTSAEIAVVVVKNLEGQDIEGYAVDLFGKWGIGQKGKDNGILFLISVEDRKYRIEVGYGLEGLIPDGRAGEIGRKILVPRIRAGDFEGGIANTAMSLAAIVAEDAGVKLSASVARAPQSGRRRGRSPFGLLFIIIIMMVFGRGRLWFLPLMFLGGGRGGYWSSGSGGFGSGMGGGGFSGGFGGGFSGGGGASGSW